MENRNFQLLEDICTQKVKQVVINSVSFKGIITLSYLIVKISNNYIGLNSS